MLVANLTRRNFVRDSLADCYCGMEDAVDGDYVKFEEAMEASSNSLQQLQAKIRAVADKLFVCHFQSGGGGLDNLALINELRELSAMQ